MWSLTNIFFKLLGFLKAKTGGSLKTLSSGVFCMVVYCSRTILEKLLSAGWYVMGNGTLLFVFFALYWMSLFLSIPLSLIKQWLLLAWHFSSPRRFVGSLFIGADAFDPESLAVWNTGGVLFWMTTLCGQLLMFICWFVVYVSWHNTIFTGNVSVQKRDVSSGCFISEFYSEVNIVGKSKKRWRFSSDSVHFMMRSCQRRLWSESRRVTRGVKII